MEEFSCATRILAGAGAVQALAQFGAKRVFLITQPSFLADGTAQRITSLTGAEQTELFSQPQPEPRAVPAAEGAVRLKLFRPDLVIALGDGNLMDSAKAMVYFARGDYPLVTVPTVSGSGAEVTDSILLAYGTVRHPLADTSLRPAAAILDSDLLAALSPAQIAESGFDLLACAAEAYAAKGAGTMSSLYAQEAFRIAYAALPASYAGHTEVRLRIQLASAMAGIACSNAGLGLCRALSRSLAAMFHLPHGQLNAALLPAVIDCNAHICACRYAALARAAGIGGSTDAIALRNLKNGLLRLRRELGLPQSLTQAGIAPEALWSNIDSLVETVLEDPCCSANPIPAEPFVIRRVLQDACLPGSHFLEGFF